MASKTPTTVKEKKPSWVCEECVRDFQTLSALKSHTMARHPEKYKEMCKPNESDIEEKKTAFVPPTSRVSKRLQQKKIERDLDSEDSSSSTQQDRQTDHSISSRDQKTVFECPKCSKVFQVNFSALKHIQNRHSVDKNDKPVPVDSPDIIKPIRREMCSVCDKVIRADNHTCLEYNIKSSKDNLVLQIYKCFGCQRHFLRIDQFDKHIETNHSKNVDKMFFTSMSEFQFWKSDMETQTKVKYEKLNVNPQKQIYHCNYLSPKNTADITHLCPSIIVTQESPNIQGIQVAYYKEHYEHESKYTLSKIYEEYLVKETTNDLFDSLKDNNMYKKLKNLLQNISINAEKSSSTSLQKLYEMALEMQRYLKNAKKRDQRLLQKMQKEASKNNIEIDDAVDTEQNTIEEISTDKENTIKNLSDDQIIVELEATRASARLKRQSESSTPAPKKIKPDIGIKKSTVTKEPTETKGLKESSNIDKSINIESPKIKPKVISDQSPSFNDTYKQFLGKIDTPKIVRRNSPSMKNSLIVKNSSSTKNLPSTPNSPSKTNSLSTKISPIAKKPKKEIVKTKMGQYSPKNKSPKTPEIANVKKKRPESTLPQVVSPKMNISHLKLEEVEYKVLEQENDCNILVLKI